MSKLEKHIRLFFFVLIIVAFGYMAIMQVTYANPPDCPPGHDNIGSCEGGNGGNGDTNGNPGNNSQEVTQTQSQGQEQGQNQDQSQTQEQTANSTSESNSSSESVSNATAVAEGGSNSQSVHFSSPRQVPPTYLQLSNNTESCVRVLGFSFANTSGSGMLGVPLPRGKACDMWKAVNEAQENGHVWLSYAFMCEIKNIRDVWGLDRCKELTEQALTQLDDLVSFGYSVEPGHVSLPEDEYEDLLLAQVQQEEIEQLEDRFAQQQNLIEELQKEAEDHQEKEAELAALKKEVEEATAKQAERIAEQRAAENKFKAILQKKGVSKDE